MGGLAKVSLPLRDSTIHRSEETLTRRLLRPSHEGNVERRESDGGEKGHHGVDEVASFPSPWRHADRRRRERIADEHLVPRFRGKARRSPRDTSGSYLCKSTWHQGRIDDMDACLAVEGHGLLMGATMMDMAGRQRVRGRTCALLSVCCLLGTFQRVGTLISAGLRGWWLLTSSCRPAPAPSLAVPAQLPGGQAFLACCLPELVSDPVSF